MNWIFLVLAAIVINAVGKVIHRHVLRDEDAISYAFIWSFLSAVFYIPILVLEPLSLPQSELQWITFFSAAFVWLVINIVGFYAYKHTDITLKAPLSSAKILFLLVFAVVVLNESLTMAKIGGTLLMFSGMGVLTWRGGSLQRLKEYGVQLTLLTGLLTAFVAIIDKFNMDAGISPAFYGLMMYLIPSMVLGGMTGFRIEKFKRMWGNKSLWVVVAALCYTAMYYLHMWAYKLTEVSNVFPVAQLGVMLAVGFGYLFLKEKTDIAQRLAGAVLMVLGASLITIGA